jgi:hypothetical protein
MTRHRSTGLTRRARAATLTLLTLAAVTTAVALGPAADAAASSPTCTGTSVIDYTPGLTNTPQTISYTETDTFSSCTSTDPTLTSGLAIASTSGSGAQCLTATPLEVNTPYDITWNNEQTSHINLDFTDVIVEGVIQVTGTGTVTSGEFTGATIVIAWVYTPSLSDLLACATSGGLTSVTGPFTTEIIGT